MHDHAGGQDGARERQAQREQAQRDAARGQRARQALRGDLGPVLKRWVTGSVLPASVKMREFAEHYTSGRFKQAGDCLSSPVFGLSQAVPERVGDLSTILRWGLKGASHMEDLTLAVVGTAMTLCASHSNTRHHGKRQRTLTSLLAACGDAARETALGQFITEVQGAKAMEAARKGKEHRWQERARLDAVGSLLAGQARSALGDDTGESHVGGRVVVTILRPDGQERRLELRRPESGDWDLLELARVPIGDADVHRAVWLSFALAVLCATQAAAGVFALVELPSRGKGKLRGLVLSPEAEDAIGGDLDKWLDMGFIQEPMVVPPEDGDYLTVKHRRVAGAPGPKGLKTDAAGTGAWEAAAWAMAGTPWTIAGDTLGAIQRGVLGPYVEASEPFAGHRQMVLGAAARLVTEEAVHLPIFMDFRGRVYYRPSAITLQGSDLQKALLVFPPQAHGDRDLDADGEEALISHVAALYGGPDKLDKAPFPAREEWWYANEGKPVLEALEGAEEPLQLYTALSMIHSGQADRVACQIDGTCNGLQHLSALFRDETAAPHVNLCASTREEAPADIYAAVGVEVARALVGVAGSGPGDTAWARRLLATVKVDRKLCKKPVMVLPYGGTRGTIEQAVLEAVIEQAPTASHNGVSLCPWRECLEPDGAGGWVRDEGAVAGNYLAFRNRELDAHPLLRLDCQRLGGLVWQAILSLLPRPMAAMKAFRGIAGYAGARALEWTPGSAPGVKPLWLVSAKSLAQASALGLRGLHLPETVRGLKVRQGRDSIDRNAHRTGIVANFIHSQDADHLARVMRRVRGDGGVPSFGAIHDCFLTRPSRMPSLAKHTRQAFAEKYGGSDQHPLWQPVRFRELSTGEVVEEFPSWYALAEACNVDLPPVGSWDPQEVMHSAWFFS